MYIDSCFLTAWQQLRRGQVTAQQALHLLRDEQGNLSLSFLDDEVSQRLASSAQNPSSLPHLFFYGPSGSGKRTRINALLGDLFGPSAHKLRLDQRTFTTPTNRTVELHMVTSPHHIELSPSDAGNNDRFVIQDVLKQLASTKKYSKQRR